MRKGRETIEWNIEQIRTIANAFEGKKLPSEMVGAIEGFCNNIEKIKMAARLQRLELMEPDR